MIVIIVVLAAAVGVMSQQMAKEKSNLKIADKKINVGDSLVVKLTDSQGNPISNQTVNIKLTYKNGTAIDNKTATNSKGNTKFMMDENGEYSVECRFDGNDKYASSSVTDNITVEKATTKVVGEEQTSTTTHASKNAPNGGIYPEYGPEVDHYGKTREFAIANDWHYIPLIIDGKDVGGYTAIDPTTGTYHT